MAHHKSAFKRIQIIERNKARNKFYRSSMKTILKNVTSSKSKKDGLTNYNKAASFLDKMVSKGILHKNTAANKKSSLMNYVNTLT
jgi:small subunit ribosomal protein S20